MAVLKLYPNGLTGGVPPRLVNHAPAPRGDCSGWSPSSSRSNTRFLYSVRSADLPVGSDGTLKLLGLALSLTLRDCPPSHQDWKNLREAFFLRLRRCGLYRLHWLTEWQKRGVPHLHAAAWFDVVAVETWMLKHHPDLSVTAFPVVLQGDWLELTAPYRSSASAQNVKPITNDLGWLQYLAKHAARGAAHYQRAFSTMPKGWQKTGRMWGHLGDFPVSEPLGLELDRPAWFQFRRIVRAWRISLARSDRKVSGRRISLARKMLQCSDRFLSEVRGVSEWIPLHLGLFFISGLASAGYSMESI